jgi:hypothetical protein
MIILSILCIITALVLIGLLAGGASTFGGYI